MNSEAFQTLIERIRSGDRDARDRMFEIVYEELRRRAGFELARADGRSLSPTVVVHEAYLRLAGAARLEPEDRAHFVRIAARAMRNFMVDRARERLSLKRGGGAEAIDIDAVEVGVDEVATQIVALDEALLRLEEKDERLAQVVQLRYYAGQSVDETADTLGVSARTVKRAWRVARAFLHAELGEGPVLTEEDDS